MKAYGWFKDAYDEAKDTFEFKLEGLELEITETILGIMDEKGISRSELAKKLGVSKASITKLLNNGSNMTLRRLLSIADALKCNVEINLLPTEELSEENFK
jgi:transcriptional regulator with XRE-family HTH domain